MKWINNSQQFGLITILLHWLSAVIIIGLFALGLYMVGLDYYSPWYHRAPRIHESIGLIFLALMLLRVLQRLINPPPLPLSSLSPLEQKLAPVVHLALYTLIFLLLVSGFIISSASGEPVAVFNWFSLPPLVLDIDNQQDVAGVWHDRIAWTLIAFTVLHALAAIKHHFVDKDTTLTRMLGIKQ